MNQLDTFIYLRRLSPSIGLAPGSVCRAPSRWHLASKGRPRRNTGQACLTPRREEYRCAGRPDYAFHPGETLAETLEALGLSQGELAQRMGWPLRRIAEIIQGKKAITAETALQLERATGVPASFWNSAQRNYEATVARLG